MSCADAPPSPRRQKNNILTEESLKHTGTCVCWETGLGWYAHIGMTWARWNLRRTVPQKPAPPIQNGRVLLSSAQPETQSPKPELGRTRRGR